MQKVIGLDFGSHSLKATLTRSTFRNFELLGFYEQPYPGVTEEGGPLTDEIMSDTVRLLFEKNQLPKDALVNCAIACNKVSIKTIQLPFKDKKRVVQTLPFELENYIPFELSEIVYDYQTIESIDAGIKLLVALVKRDQIDHYLSVLESSVIDPKIITVDALSLANLTTVNLKANKDSYVIIEIGHSKTNFCFIDQGVVRMARSIAVGGLRLTRALIEKLDIGYSDAQKIKHERGAAAIEGEEPANDDEKVVIEVLRPVVQHLTSDIIKTIRTYEGSEGRKVNEIYLCGGTYKLKNFPQYLSAATGIKSYPLKYLEGEYNKIPKKFGKGAILANGLGIAMSGGSATHVTTINFRHGEYTYKKDFSEIRPLVIRYASMTIILILLMFINLYSKYSILKNNDEKLSDEILSIFKDTVPGVKVGDKELNKTSSILKARINENKSRIETLQLDEPTALDLLKTISSLIPIDISIDINELSIDQSRVLMKGETNSITSVDKIVESLKTYDKFTNVEKGEVKDGFKPGFKRFTLTITVNLEV